jgi:uncharacterized protein (TIGR04255 family)
MEKQLQNAPITEALLDIRVELPLDTTLQSLERVHDRINKEYPVRRERIDFTARFDTNARSVSMQELRNTGFFFWSTDERQAMQARLDGFALSRLKPYDSWGRLRDEARKLWNVYVQTAEPLRITRVALRYINRLELPQPVQFEDYLRTFPHLSEACPQIVSGLFMRVATERGPDRVIISEAIEEQSTEAHRVPIILDIDASRIVDIPIAAEEDAWSALEELRKLKNEVFFGSITERAEALFQ